MLSPTTTAGANPRFYKINKDLSVDIDSLKKNITKHTKAIISTHYFGFPQKEMHALRDLCDNLDISLIEDCAHALYGEFAGKNGHYAVASLQKFLPVIDGGLLISGKNIQSAYLDRRSLKRETKILYNTLENWLHLNRGTKQQPGKNDTSDAVMHSDEKGSSGTEVDTKNINTKMSLTSGLISKLVSHGRIKEQRRANYEHLAGNLDSIPGCTVLHDTLPEGVVPYVLPLLVNKPDPAYQDIRRQGIHIQRWEPAYHGNITGHCQTSDHYANHLFQIPCHQELTARDIADISCVIEDALNS